MSLKSLAFTAAMLAAVSPAHATLMISGQPTRHVDCSGGICTATSAHANLKAADLAGMLGAGDVTVVAGSQARDIVVSAALGWSSVHRLTLHSFGAITLLKSISVTGTGALTLTTNDGGSGGTLSFTGRNSISFLDTSSSLVINGASYVLVGDLQTLSNDVAANASGNYALARTYNAGPDGVYSQNPVTTIFSGTFEGLGNAIKNLKIKNNQPGTHIGLFYGNSSGSISDLHLDNESVKAGRGASAGGLAGICASKVANVDMSGKVTVQLDGVAGGICGELGSTMTGSHSSGTITGAGDDGDTQNWVGGLVGQVLGGTIEDSYSTAKVVGAKGWSAGGLVGEADELDTIDSSYATGVVSVGDNGLAGGLVGHNIGQTISNSYATGFVLGGVNSTVGGLIGFNSGAVSDSYSTGPVASGSGNAVGGFVGNDAGTSDLTDDYFDITTSGQSHGAGNNTNDPGITGLTTEQFQAGLPSGFDPAIWAEDSAINGGLPYLLALSPH